MEKKTATNLIIRE